MGFFIVAKKLNIESAETAAMTGTLKTGRGGIEPMQKKSTAGLNVW